ncbi:hypothetical protein DFH28DRAFT_1126061 [Melampsora americana]|nr:hypothetical protein DFH28DRAFT_1126061 [Melampsora americana]
MDDVAGTLRKLTEAVSHLAARVVAAPTHTAATSAPAVMGPPSTTVNQVPWSASSELLNLINPMAVRFLTMDDLEAYTATTSPKGDWLINSLFNRIKTNIGVADCPSTRVRMDLGTSLAHTAEINAEQGRALRFDGTSRHPGSAAPGVPRFPLPNSASLLIELRWPPIFPGPPNSHYATTNHQPPSYVLHQTAVRLQFHSITIPSYETIRTPCLLSPNNQPHPPQFLIFNPFLDHYHSSIQFLPKFSIMLNKQNTIESFVNSGYKTDDNPTPHCRLSRIVTPVRQHPSMITPSSDSQWALAGSRFFVRDVQDAHVHRRQEQSASLPGDKVTSNKDGYESSIVLVNDVEIENTGNQVTVEDRLGSPEVDLAQDSDDENMCIRKRKRNQPEDKPYDCEFKYFEPPTHGPNDEPDLPGLSYKCQRCHKVVQAILAGANLPLTVSELRAQRLRDNHQQSLTSFVESPPTFTNMTLNQWLAFWQVSHASIAEPLRNAMKFDPISLRCGVAAMSRSALKSLPSTNFIVIAPLWKSQRFGFGAEAPIKDPIVQAIIYWLRPDLHVFGCKWSADEIKLWYLSLCDMVIEKELKELSKRLDLCGPSLEYETGCLASQGQSMGRAHGDHPEKE